MSNFGGDLRRCSFNWRDERGFRRYWLILLPDCAELLLSCDLGGESGSVSVNAQCPPLNVLYVISLSLWFCTLDSLISYKL